MSYRLPTISTSRLTLSPLSEIDAALIFELLNSKGWLQFIGDRNIKTTDDAIKYIRKIRLDSCINYWVAKETATDTSVGVFTFIKRSYLNHHDIGFGLLPEHMGNGFAFEGADALMKEMIKSNKHEQVLATVLPENEKSIKLLQKLGLTLEGKIEVDGKFVDLYSKDFIAMHSKKEIVTLSRTSGI